MEKINLTSVNSETREIIKKQVVSMLKKGKKHTEIAETVGISKYAVDRISSMYKRKGTSYIKEKKRGRKFGEKRQLTPCLISKIPYINVICRFSTKLDCTILTEQI